MANLPSFTRHCFWDVNFDALDTELHSFFIIERILDFGDDRSFFWLLNHYAEEEIKDVVMRGTNLSRKSGYFWKSYFDLEENEISCLRTQLHRGQRRYWNE